MLPLLLLLEPEPELLPLLPPILAAAELLLELELLELLELLEPEP